MSNLQAFQSGGSHVPKSHLVDFLTFVESMFVGLSQGVCVFVCVRETGRGGGATTELV